MAKGITKRTLEEIRFRNDIVDVVGSYFNLKKAGTSFKALCPFHKEKTPSFHVNPQRQIYHCFGCGAGGDVFRFLMQMEGVDFIAAVKMLAQRAGMRIELEEADEHAGEKDVLYSIHSKLATLYHRALLESKSGKRAREYLEKRGLSKETIEEFLIGYAPDRWDAVYKWAGKNNYSPEQMEQAGLIVRRNGKGTGRSDAYDRFRNRIMFPIFDEQNRVIGFSGRLLDNEAKQAKYVNSPETPLFQKGRVLYGLNKARRHITEVGEALVCEGQIDVIRCHQEGIPTAVAAQGTAFTEQHARILRRYADSACIVFDPDKAGQDAAVRSAVVFMETGLAVRIAVLPKGEDPDSFLKKQGADAFGKILKSALSVVDFQIEVLSSREDVTSEVGVMRVAKAVLQTISQSPNAVQRARLVQRAAERLRLPASALQDDLRYLLRRSSYSRDRAEPGPTTKGNERPVEELRLCEHLVHAVDEPELVSLVEKYLPMEMVSDPDCRAFFAAAITASTKGIPIQETLYSKGRPSDGLQEFAARVQMAPAKVVGNEYSHADAVRDLILRLWRRRLRDERAKLKDRDEQRRLQITCDLNSLKSWERGVAVIEMELAE